MREGGGDRSGCWGVKGLWKNVNLQYVVIISVKKINYIE